MVLELFAKLSLTDPESFSSEDIQWVCMWYDSTTDGYTLSWCVDIEYGETFDDWFPAADKDQALEEHAEALGIPKFDWKTREELERMGLKPYDFVNDRPTKD